jgi:hypothetical protein
MTANRGFALNWLLARHLNRERRLCNHSRKGDVLCGTHVGFEADYWVSFGCVRGIRRQS